MEIYVGERLLRMNDILNSRNNGGNYIMDYNKEQIELKKFFDHYMSLATEGVVFAQSYIAEAYFWGWGVDADYDKFIAWDTKAAMGESLPSSRRMFVYYYLKGNFEMAATLYTRSNSAIPKRGSIWTTDDFRKIYGKSNTLENFLDIYNAAVDVSEEYRVQYRTWRLGVDKLFRAIALIFGFGCQKDYDRANTLLQEVDYSEDVYYSSWGNDCVNYMYSLTEIGCEINHTILEHLSQEIDFKYMNFFKETYGSFIRHAIHLALAGDKIAAKGLGYNISQERDNLENEKRKYFYYDDKDALNWYLMALDPGNCHATIDAIKIASDTMSKGYDYREAINLCYYALNNINYNSDDTMSRDYSDKLTKSFAVKALVKLAIITNDEKQKNQMAQDALSYLLSQINDPDNRNPLQIGIIYCEIYNDYKTALPWLEDAEKNGWSMEALKYIDKCKRNGVIVKDKLNGKDILAIVGFIVSIISICFGGIFATAEIILGILGLKSSKRGLAIAAIIISGISMVTYIAIMLIYS